MKRVDYWKLEGMLTVEASFVISMVTIVIGIIISLMFHEYRICWYTQASCETVLAGSSQGVVKGKSGLEYSQKRWNQLKQECYMIPSNFTETLSENNDKILVSCKGTSLVWGMQVLHMCKEVEQRICKPVNYIRKIMMINQMAGNIYDTGI